MDLVRKILLEIEKQYKSTAIINLKIESYDMETVAYHCKILLLIFLHLFWQLLLHFLSQERYV